MPDRSARRVVSRLLLVVLGLELVYLIAGNGFLWSDWGRGVLNRKPDKLVVEWTRAWTWLPGLVSFRELRLGGSARRADWRASVEEGRMLISLPSLARKHFRLLDSRAVGGAVEVDVKAANDIAVSRPGRRRGWQVTLGGLTIDPLEVVRVNEHQLEGIGRFRGRARFQVRGPMELDIAELGYLEARLLTGDEVAAESVEILATVAVAPFIVGDDAIGDVLAGTTGTLQLDAEASGLGFLAAYLGAVPWLELGGQGHLEVDLEVTDGWLAPGSRLDLRGPTVTARYFDLEARGEGTVHGSVPEGGANTEINVLLGSFSVVRPKDDATLLSGRDLDLRITNDSTAIDRPAAGIAFEVSVPDAEIPDFSAFSPYIPAASGLVLTGGSGMLGADLTYSVVERSGRGRFELRGDRVEAAFGDVVLHSRVRLDGRLGEMRLDDGAIELGGSRLTIDQTRVSENGAITDEGWWGNVLLETGSWTNAVAARERVPGVLQGMVRAKLRDTGPLVALVAKYARRLAWFDGILTVHDVEASAEARTQGATLSLRGLEVTGGEKQRLELRGELDLEEKRPSGVFFAGWGPLTAAVALEDGERDWKLTRSRRWYEERARLYRGGEIATGRSATQSPANQ